MDIVSHSNGNDKTPDHDLAVQIIARMVAGDSPASKKLDKIASVLPDDLRRSFMGEVLKVPISGPLVAAEAEKEAAPRYIIRTAKDALAPQPPIDWIVDRLFSAGSVSLVVGEPGSKKTYSMLHAAACVSAGLPWLGLPTRAARALLIDEESGDRRMARRLSAILKGSFMGEDAPICYVSLAQFNFREQNDLDELHRLIILTSSDFVVIDALADVMLGGDENAVKDVMPVIQGLKKIAEQTGAAIVVIHHTNKAGGYRGSSAMKGGVDLLLNVKSPPESDIINFSTEKTRDVEAFSFAGKIYFSGEQVWINPTEIDRGNDSELVGQEKDVRDYLSEHGPALTRDIKSATGVKDKAIQRLQDKGVIKRVNGGGQGVPAKYALTNGGSDAGSE